MQKMRRPSWKDRTAMQGTGQRRCALGLLRRKRPGGTASLRSPGPPQSPSKSLTPMSSPTHRCVCHSDENIFAGSLKHSALYRLVSARMRNGQFLRGRAWCKCFRDASEGASFLGRYAGACMCA
jgi:hypothetical protein